MTEIQDWWFRETHDVEVKIEPSTAPTQEEAGTDETPFQSMTQGRVINLTVDSDGTWSATGCCRLLDLSVDDVRRVIRGWMQQRAAGDTGLMTSTLAENAAPRRQTIRRHGAKRWADAGYPVEIIADSFQFTGSRPAADSWPEA